MTTCGAIASAACSDLGYLGAPVDGTAFSDQRIAEATTKAFVRQRADFPLVCGASPREDKRRAKAFKSAVESDVRDELGLGILAGILLIFGGPLALVLLIVGAVFQWLLERELEAHWQGMYVAAAMEAA